MRSRPWIAWLIFAAGALLVLEGLGWVTWQALRFESREREARAESRTQEAIRLALWRMESELAPIIAQESARPYFHYRSFYPADGAYDSMWRHPAPGAVLVSSPLLESAGLFTKLHFQIEPDGQVTSPQSPLGDMRERALAASSVGGAGLTPELLMLADQRLAQLAGIIARERGRPELGERAAGAPVGGNDPAAGESAIELGMELVNAPPQALSLNEFQARQQMAQSAREYGESLNASPSARGRQDTGLPTLPDGPTDKSAATPVEATRKFSTSGPPSSIAGTGRDGGPPSAEDDRDREPRRVEREDGSAGIPGDQADPMHLKIDPGIIQLGPLGASWVPPSPDQEPELLLTRAVRVADAITTQGVWLDWPVLAARLTRLASGLLPGSRVVPALGQVPFDQQGRLLATIPVLLEPGPTRPPEHVGLSTTRVTLGATWLAVLGAIGAIGWVLRSSMDLSDRRGRFVSAVTHELRTPLTSFCLYTDMLADGMVQGESERARYLGTLQSESRRLARLVENVLSFSRLNQSRAPAPPVMGTLDLAGAMARIDPVLRQRAQSVGMELVVEGFDAVGSARADADTLERVLFNLVDNAAKYAGEASDRRIIVRAWREPEPRGGAGGRVWIEIRDFGPGVPDGDRRRIFDAFYRSRRDAQSPKAGLGLGLALARGLARQLGGDLELLPADGPGARFRVVLPAAD
jgi:signal transduction histidine kinase